MEVVFKNDLISLEWTNDKLCLFDSDGEYIDYLFEIYNDNTKQEREPEIQLVIDEINGKSEKEICDFLDSHFYDVADVVYGPLSAEQMKELKEEYGEEFVNRIGNSAVIIRE